MDKKELEQLKVALSLAKQEALKHSMDGDGGTCNLDTPLIKLVGTNEQELQKLFGEEYGVSYYNENWYSIGYKVLSGQAHRRTMMAMEFVITLQDNGYKSFVHYVID